MKTCFVDGCKSPVYHSGQRKSRSGGLTEKYCRKHYRWLTERGTLEPPRNYKASLEERFWHKVEKSDGCWKWIGPRTGKGYGVISGETVETNKRSKMLLAHRVSYQLANGDLTDVDFVLHSCDNPQCVNPAHLRKGTQSENIKEAIEKGRKFNPRASGANHPQSKLTLEQARYIKAHPEKRLIDLAEEFGLSPNCIRGVRIGRTWKDA